MRQKIRLRFEIIAARTIRCFHKNDRTNPLSRFMSWEHWMTKGGMYIIRCLTLSIPVFSSNLPHSYLCSCVLTGEENSENLTMVRDAIRAYQVWLLSGTVTLFPVEVSSWLPSNMSYPYFTQTMNSAGALMLSKPIIWPKLAAEVFRKITFPSRG